MGTPNYQTYESLIRQVLPTWNSTGACAARSARLATCSACGAGRNRRAEGDSAGQQFSIQQLLGAGPKKRNRKAKPVALPRLHGFSHQYKGTQGVRKPETHPFLGSEPPFEQKGPQFGVSCQLAGEKELQHGPKKHNQTLQSRFSLGKRKPIHRWG